MQLLGHMVVPCLAFKKLLFYIPTSYVWVIQFLYILIIWCCHNFLFQPFWKVCSDISLWFYFLIYLMVNDFEHIICLFDICISFLVKCLFMSFTYFLIELLFCLLVCVFLLSFDSSLYILDTNSLLDIWLANIFSYSLVCLFILLTRSFTEQNILIWVNWIYQFFFI